MSGTSTNKYIKVGRNLELNLSAQNETLLRQIAWEYYARFISFIYDKSPRKFFEPRFTKNYFREESWRIGK